MNKSEFLAALGVGALSPRAEAVYAAAVQDAADGNPFLSAPFLEGLEREYALFGDMLPFVLKSAETVRGNPALSLCACLAKALLASRETGGVLPLADLPQPDAARFGSAFEMALYFAELSFLPDMVAYDRAHGVPSAITADTLRDCFGGSLQKSPVYLGRNGFELGRNFEWNQYYLNHSIYRVGVLNFERRKLVDNSMRILTDGRGAYRILAAEQGQGVGACGHLQGALFVDDAAFTVSFEESETAYIGHPVDSLRATVSPETVSLSKNEWHLAITPEDDVISVHIPENTNFSPELVEKAYRDARAFFTACFPDFCPKAYTCFSWMMAGELPQVLREGSNILAFQRRYLRFPLKGVGRGVLAFAFGMPMAEVGGFTAYHTLPEATSLQRNIKALYVSGQAVYEAAGIFFPVGC